MSYLKKLKKDIPPLPKSMWRNPLHFIAFGFGAGAMPFAPGTFGTLIAIPFYLLLQPLPLIYYITVVTIMTVGAIWLSDHVAKVIHVHDHPGMCIDEVIGYLITMINAPKGFFWIVLGFILFRIFDIWKPWPIRTIDERVGGGFGIILDDIIAALYSLIGLQLLNWIY
jgi:phosphatidylglycerophosphatase A